MKKGYYLILGIGVIFLFNGCVSAYKTLRINSIPQKAEVFVNSEKVGETSLDIILKYNSQKSKIKVKALKAGFKPEEKMIDYIKVRKGDFFLFELREDKRQVLIDSTPQGAGVYINNIRKGETPLNVEISFVNPETKDLSSVFIEAEKKGFETSKGEKRATEVLKYDDRKKEINFVFIKEKEVEMVVHEIKEEILEGVKRLVLKKRKVIAELDVIERSPNVESVTRITNFQGKVEIGTPILSPDGKTLIFQAMDIERDLVSSYYLCSLKIGAGPGITRVTHTKGGFGDIDPISDPEGKYIYFASDRENNRFNIWRIQSKGIGGLTRITSSLASDTEPDISPDGKELVYTSLPPIANLKQIWMIQTNGSLPTQLREGEFPKWSPDNSRIVYVAKDKLTGLGKIWMINTDGSNPTQLTFGENSYEKEPRWSPDSKKIVFVSNEGLTLKRRHNDDIWIMNADGSEITQLTTNGSVDDHPAWGTKGNYIYFRSNRGASWDIWRTKIIKEKDQ